MSRCGKKNPELTVCQVHTAVSAVVRSWWLDGAAAKQLFQQASKKIAYRQHHNAQARKSHTKTTRKLLKQLGIDLTKTKTISWNTS